MTRMASAVAALLLALSLANGRALAQAAEDAIGVWLNPENQFERRVL